MTIKKLVKIPLEKTEPVLKPLPFTPEDRGDDIPWVEDVMENRQVAVCQVKDILEALEAQHPCELRWWKNEVYLPELKDQMKDMQRVIDEQGMQLSEKDGVMNSILSDKQRLMNDQAVLQMGLKGAEQQINGLQIQRDRLETELMHTKATSDILQSLLKSSGEHEPPRYIITCPDNLAGPAQIDVRDYRNLDVARDKNSGTWSTIITKETGKTRFYYALATGLTQDEAKVLFSLAAEWLRNGSIDLLPEVESGLLDCQTIMDDVRKIAREPVEKVSENLN